MKQVCQNSIPFTERGYDSQEVVITNRSLLKFSIEKFSIFLIGAAKESDRWQFILMLRHIMQIFGPAEVFEPREVFGKSTDCTRILFPGEHGLISWERMICKYFTSSLYFCPINRAFL
jgi:hypothetical protein